MILELLYLLDCPHHGATLDLIDSVLQAETALLRVRQILVKNYEEACAYGFPGSPTVRVNGKDIEHVPADRLGVAYACRTYFVEGKPQGVPPRWLVEQAIRRARRQEAHG
ncbi:MAG TPA: hypothetical protein VJS11_06540 [Acidobacteriaceae bacterium]|nr:hypothetical protein [Acidobacteriaceae bacterium]